MMPGTVLSSRGMTWPSQPGAEEPLLCGSKFNYAKQAPLRLFMRTLKRKEVQLPCRWGQLQVLESRLATECSKYTFRLAIGVQER